MKFIATGDSLFSSGNLKETIDPQLFEILKGADAAFTNAEFVTPRPQTRPAAGRGYQTSVRPELLKEFAELNIRYVGFANNHTGDYGIEGMIDTMEEAKAAGLHPLGIGMDLTEAQKPVFIDTKDGRIAIITVDITRSEVFAASVPGNGVPARPGVNPLRWNRQYVVDAKDFETITEIAKRVGVYQSMQIGREIETFKGGSDDLLAFGSLFEGSITFKRGETAGVYTYANEKDQEAILRRIRDAACRADYVFVNFHSHEGENENWYCDYPAIFVEKFAHLAVENGADCVFGHGAHFARGIELYNGKPIFYNLGSLVMQFESGESIISPEMNESYGYAIDEVPSTLHKNRAKDENGNWIGFNSDPMFSGNFFVSFDLNRDEDRFDYELHLLDLRMQDRFPTKRGLPVPARGDFETYMLNRLNKISNDRYHTKIVREDGRFVVRPVE